MVKELSDKDFSLKDEKNKFVFIDFYASWCPHCQRLAPIFEKLAQEVKKEKLKCQLVKLDADKYDAIGNQQNVKYYPDIRLYSDGKLVEQYNGEVEGEKAGKELMAFLKKHVSNLKY